jgi:hypothetical protein
MCPAQYLGLEEGYHTKCGCGNTDIDRMAETSMFYDSGFSKIYCCSPFIRVENFVWNLLLGIPWLVTCFCFGKPPPCPKQKVSPRFINKYPTAVDDAWARRHPDALLEHPEAQRIARGEVESGENRELYIQHLAKKEMGSQHNQGQIDFAYRELLDSEDGSNGMWK